MDNHIGTHHEDRITPDDMPIPAIDPTALMTDEEVSSAMFQVQLITPKLLAAPYRQLIATFENADALRALADQSVNWAETYRRIRRNHAIVLVLRQTQNELKQILSGFKRHENLDDSISNDGLRRDSSVHGESR